MTTQANIPLKWYVPFANGDVSRVEIPVTTADPTRASQTLGFPPLTMQPPESGGVPPQGEDFNGGMNQVARVCWWVLNGGGWPYDASFATQANILGYPNGAKLQSADFRGDWISTADSNQNNPDSNGTGWVPGFQYGVTALTGLTGGTVTPTPAQAAKGTITLAGTLTSALTIVVPTWLKNWVIINSTTGAFVTIVKTAAGSGVTIPQDSSRVAVVGDGTNIVSAAPSNVAGRLLRTTVYSRIAGVQNISVDGGAPTTSGATTFIALPSTNAVEVECQAAGGGGGGAALTGAGQIAIGTSGQAGTYGRGRYTSSFSGLTVTVGAAGTAGASGANAGGAGGTSSFGALLTTPGGNGGPGGAANTAGLILAQPFGVSGASTGANLYEVRGGGGTGAIALSASQVISGVGGTSSFGAGAQPGFAGAGVAGTNPGTGGSGGAVGQSSGTSVAGGAGGPGIIIVREYA